MKQGVTGKKENIKKLIIIDFFGNKLIIDSSKWACEIHMWSRERKQKIEILISFVK